MIDLNLNETYVDLNNGIKLYTRYSNAMKDKLLLLHFSGGNGYMWDPVLEYFLEKYDVIIPDLRGHGLSEKPESSYHIDDLADDISLLMNHLEIESCHVIGSSMGAEIGLSLAARYPSLVKTFVCEGALINEYGPYGYFDETKIIPITQMQSIKFNTPQEFFDYEKQKIEQFCKIDDKFSNFIYGNMEGNVDGTYSSRYTNMVRNSYIEEYRKVKFENYYRDIKCPILFLPSVEEYKEPKINHSLSYFTSLLDKFEVKVIPDSVHAFLWMQLPKESASVALSFIEKYI